MKFKPGADIPVGTVVYKNVYNCKTDRKTVLTCIVTKPGFCPLQNDENKCRVRQVLVIGASSKGTDFRSIHDYNFKYKLYTKAKPTRKFDADRWSVCTSGIHVFLSKRRAERY